MFILKAEFRCVVYWQKWFAIQNWSLCDGNGCCRWRVSLWKRAYSKYQNTL